MLCCKRDQFTNAIIIRLTIAVLRAGRTSVTSTQNVPHVQCVKILFQLHKNHLLTVSRSVSILGIRIKVFVLLSQYSTYFFVATVSDKWIRNLLPFLRSIVQSVSCVFWWDPPSSHASYFWLNSFSFTRLPFW